MVDDQARLEPLKTIHEARADEKFVKALVVEIPAKLASKTLSILKPHLTASCNGDALSFHHLRRIVTGTHLPTEFRERNEISASSALPPTVFLLLPTLSDTMADTVTELLRTCFAHEIEGFLPRLFDVIVPLYPPTTAERASLWSEKYWPCIFNPASQTIQNGPPLHLLRSTLAEIGTEMATTYLKLAQNAGDECMADGVGKRVGAVVVDAASNEVVVAAGDARWWKAGDSTTAVAATNQWDGRPEHHALMRAIAMVAQKERTPSSGEVIHTSAPASLHDLGGSPLTSIERRYLHVAGESLESLDNDWLPPAQSVVQPDAYLCNGLDVYLTHEPCVCCAMAMVHSRFRACIFETKMPGTGGLCAETEDGNLGYGLFWRKELNWRVMTFLYIPGKHDPASTNHERDIFHA